MRKIYGRISMMDLMCACMCMCMLCAVNFSVRIPSGA